MAGWGYSSHGSGAVHRSRGRFAEEYRQRGVTVQTFGDLQTALDWLGSVRSSRC
jgi:hypothetical protein